MTIADAIQRAAKRIERHDAEVLLCHILRKDAAYLIAHATERLPLPQRLFFFYLALKREHNTPIAYIIHEKEFFGLPFIVNHHTLIPRPETELLVEKAIEAIERQSSDRSIYVDVGTGSGCIPVSILHATKKKIETHAIDISQPALHVAQKNAMRHRVSINFHHGNLLIPMMPIFAHMSDVALVVTANLPYLTKEQVDSEPSIQKEPKTALIADNGGLALYADLLEQLSTVSFSTLTCFLEIDPSQHERIVQTITLVFPNAMTTVHTDWKHAPRVVEITVQKQTT
ncbi:MAG TPA: HemK/PrmC family methyltransferase [Candidatus Kapabacteria bacterium]|nr:HemK/PrmC family methyltransferase [Candidatus Kapabacteria bacterium]